MKLNDLSAICRHWRWCCRHNLRHSELIQAFDEKWDIEFPILKDVDRQHVEAWGVRNQEYGPGTFGYGIPYPGVVFISPDGQILAKWAEPGYRSRADWSKVLQDVTAMVGAE